MSFCSINDRAFGKPFRFADSSHRSITDFGSRIVNATFGSALAGRPITTHDRLKTDGRNRKLMEETEEPTQGFKKERGFYYLVVHSKTGEKLGVQRYYRNEITNAVRIAIAEQKKGNLVSIYPEVPDSTRKWAAKQR